MSTRKQFFRTFLAENLNIKGSIKYVIILETLLIITEKLISQKLMQI